MYLAIALASIGYLFGQLATGTDPLVAILLTAAIGFGLLSIPAAGGLSTAAGVLNGILLGKFLLIGVALKILTLEPSDKTLRSPRETAMVMAVGFFAVMLATLLQRQIPVRQPPPIPGIADPRTYLALTVVFLVIGYGGYFLALASDFDGGAVQTGGFLGIARVFSRFSSLAVVPALYYPWVSRSKRFMTHPLPLAILVLGLVIGLITTSKEGAMATAVFYLLTAASRYGIRDKKILTLALAGVGYYVLIVYPYAQYVRHSGGRQGSFSERIEAMQEALVLTFTDPEFRRSVDGKLAATESSYFETEELHPFSRLAMIGEADRLIDGTGRDFTGSMTVEWSVKVLVPSFLLHDKPIYGPSNFFAHIAGDLSPMDETTQVAYGLMAGLYNAYGYQGVFLGCLILLTTLYYSFRFWFGDPKWTGSAIGSSLWFLVIVSAFQHTLVEDGVSGVLGGLLMPIETYLLYRLASIAVVFLPARMMSAISRHHGWGRIAPA